MEIVRAVIGLAVLIAIAYVLSGKRKQVDWRLVGVGLLLQVVIAVLISKVPVVQSSFEWVSAQFVTFLGFSADGAAFVFGDLARNSGVPGLTDKHSLGFLFAFQALPTVIFFASITAGLYYLGVLQKIVYVFAWIMAKTMGLSGAESMSAAGNIFLGQTEAPLLVKPFVSNMTKSELMCLMTGGMATIAGSVLGLYVSFLGGDSDAEKTQFATYLLSASVMNAPAAILMAKIFLPETEPEKIDRTLKVNRENIGVNLIDSLAGGASDGLKLALNIGAMLIAFIAIIFALNWILMDGIGSWTGLNEFVVVSTNGVFKGFNLQYILGQVFRLFAYAMGVDWSETLQVGSLLGQKVVINELVAYKGLGDMKNDGMLSAKAIVISTYALCGFANFSSIAIQIGGIGAMAPNRQSDLSKLGMRALAAATLATMMTATIAGALFST